MEKKTHTVKNNVVSGFDNRILYLSPTYAGSVHDKHICDEEPLQLPDGINVWQDTGYQGHSPENACVLQPFKKPRGKELSDWQKRFNQTISSIRVRVEHAIGGVKRFRIAKERLRNFKNDCKDTAMLLACGLHNFLVSLRPVVQAPKLYCTIDEKSSHA